MVHAFKSHKAKKSLQLQGQPGLHSQFQHSQGYRMRTSCLKQKIPVEQKEEDASPMATKSFPPATKTGVLPPSGVSPVGQAGAQKRRTAAPKPEARR